jgi:hypothetical protein
MAMSSTKDAEERNSGWGLVFNELGAASDVGL